MADDYSYVVTPETEARDLRIELNRVLNLHNRNLEDAATALRVDRGHHCDCRKTLDAIMQRSWQAIKKP